MQILPSCLVHGIIALSVASCWAAPETVSEGSDKNKMVCLDTPRHKPYPSPEPGIHKTCGAYESLSCCKNDTVTRLHGSDFYALNKFVCKNKKLSSRCMKFFMADACFYECSPELGPYMQKDTSAEEPIENIPLCKSECENWFAACSNDFTCVKDWKKASADGVECNETDKCQTFQDKFQTATNFCRKIWGNSYEVVADSEKCFKIDVSKNSDDGSPSADDSSNSSSGITYNIVILTTIISVGLAQY